MGKNKKSGIFVIQRRFLYYLEFYRILLGTAGLLKKSLFIQNGRENVEQKISC
jgi:hypothetical protein